MNNWKPIETAPKTGRWILAINASTIFARQHVVKYFEEERANYKWKTGSGHMDWVVGLTHWMELPEPPNE